MPMLDISMRQMLYPLGYFSALCFTLRFAVQWLVSEAKGKAVTPRSFWQLSLAGNLTLALHSFIQWQFPVYMVQVINAFISWRHLDLSRPNKQPFPLRHSLFIFLASLTAAVLAFFAQTPPSPHASPFGAFSQETSLLFECFGIIAITLFSLRFWVQWMQSEQSKTASLSPFFFWSSLIGGIFSIIYFARIYDPVNLIGPLFGLIPYVRNLILMRQESHAAKL
jgi:lipid-A-disaccharide synthase